MPKNKLIENYKLQKQRTEEAAKIYAEMEDAITDCEYSEHAAFRYKKPKIKCIGVYKWDFLSYEEWRYKDTMYNFVKCPEFEKAGGCKASNCIYHKDYMNYCIAKNNYEMAKKELRKYPLWVMFIMLFQRKTKNSKEK